MTTRPLLLAALAAVLLTIGCNPGIDQLNDPEHDPVATLAYELSGLSTVGEDLHLGLIWTRQDEQGQSSRLGGTIPVVVADGQLQLYGPPPVEMLQAQGETRIALGRIVLLEDRDGDGLFQYGDGQLHGADTVAGIAYDQLLLWVEDPGADLEGLVLNQERLAGGYQLARTGCGEDADRLEIDDAAVLTVSTIELRKAQPSRCR